jgi:imidazolonepropionase
MAPSGGSELAAELGALSADHLGCPSAAGIEALAGAARSARPVVAVLLPTVPWFLGQELREPARALIEAGIPVAIGTDFNPGTAPVPSLPLAMSVAMLRLGLTPAEVLAATTVNAAAALGLVDRGALSGGLRADVVVWDVPTHTQLPYWAGADLARVVIAGGQQVPVRTR